MTGLQAIVSALLSFYGANMALGLFLFLIVEEAGVPLWFLPGDVLVLQAGSQSDHTRASAAPIILAAPEPPLARRLLYFIVR